ncbi:MAG: hypothetical protein JSU73_01985 [candidate division WOR-3 bacterium]|nr:MAG: hypothetical protein JSU73_01985 [candidate division WOR-3 bacterium]
MDGRILRHVLLVTGAAVSLTGAQPRSYARLESHTQDLTRTLVTGDSREMYRLFVPAFQQEIPFARFESTLIDWYDGRTVTSARSKVVDIRGLGGYVSTWVTFAGEERVCYLFQRWLHATAGWQLVWLTNILDQSFLYGRADTAELEAVIEASLQFLVGDGGLSLIRDGLLSPDSIFVVHTRTRNNTSIDNRPVIWFDQSKPNRKAVKAPYYFRVQLAQVLGEAALCNIDLKPTWPQDPGFLGRVRSIELYLLFDPDAGKWTVNSVGKVF